MREHLFQQFDVDGKTSGYRYLWEKHPETAGGNVQHVSAVSSRTIPSHRQGRTNPVPGARFTTMPGTRKALSLVGKGP